MGRGGAGWDGAGRGGTERKVSAKLRSSFLFSFFFCFFTSFFLFSFVFALFFFFFRFLRFFFFLFFCFSFYFFFPQYCCPSLPSCGRWGEKVNDAEKCTMSERSEEGRKTFLNTESNLRCSDREPSRHKYATVPASATRIRDLLIFSQHKMKPNPS